MEDPVLKMLNPRLPTMCCICGAYAREAKQPLNYSESTDYLVAKKTKTYTVYVPVCEDCRKKLQAYSRPLLRFLSIPALTLGLAGGVLSIAARWDFYAVFGAVLAPAAVGALLGGILNKVFNKAEKLSIGHFYGNGFSFQNQRFCEAFAELNPEIPVEYSEEKERSRSK